jgi:HAE1 family hydrophobic/amphiphilic exporter-1
MVSLLVSFTLTPMMSARLLHDEQSGGLSGETSAKAGHDAAKSRSGFYARIDGAYEWMLQWSMDHRMLIAGVAILVAFSSIPLYSLVRQEFVPSGVDEGEFEVSVTAPEGSSLAAMNDAIDQVEKEVRSIPGVRLVLASVGGSFLGAVNQGELYVRLVPHEERVFGWGRLVSSVARLDPLSAFRNNYSQGQVMQDVRRRLRKFPELRGNVRNIQSLNLGGGRGDLDLAIRGPELTRLAEYGEKLRLKAPEIGIVDADSTLRLNKPELQVQIDRNRAADLGVSTGDIATALRVMVGGDEEVTRFRDSSVNDDYNVQLRLAERDRNNPATLGQLFVPRGNGELVRLDNLVQIVQAESPSRIDRQDRQRQVNVRANVAPGFAQADRMQAMQQAARELNMPAAYSTAVAGRARELERTFREFLWAFLLSVIFMYMILASQFESLVHPFTILLSLPLAIPFALFSLWAMDQTLNLYSALGLLVLFGVVKKNAILQIDHMNNLRREGQDRLHAIMEANRDRLRPILMTTLALVGGMLPLALGTGPGAEERRSIAVVVIGGQTLSLLLTLLVTPVAYSLFDDLATSDALGRLAFWKKSGRTAVVER